MATPERKPRRTDLAERLARARQWRIDTRPFFDAIYGPETRPGNCPACGNRTRVPV